MCLWKALALDMRLAVGEDILGMRYRVIAPDLVSRQVWAFRLGKSWRTVRLRAKYSHIARRKAYNIAELPSRIWSD